MTGVIYQYLWHTCGVIYQYLGYTSTLWGDLPVYGVCFQYIGRTSIPWALTHSLLDLVLVTLTLLCDMHAAVPVCTSMHVNRSSSVNWTGSVCTSSLVPAVPFFSYLPPITDQNVEKDPAIFYPDPARRAIFKDKVLCFLSKQQVCVCACVRGCGCVHSM